MVDRGARTAPESLSGWIDGLEAEGALQDAVGRPLLLGDERHDDAGLPGPARAPRPVQVVGVVGGRVEVHDTGQILDVNASSGHVGGHQRPGPAVGEGRQGPFALGLGLAAVDGESLDAAGVELHGDTIRTASGAAEDECPAVLADERDGDRDPLLSGDAPEQVRRRRSRRARRWPRRGERDRSGSG